METVSKRLDRTLANDVATAIPRWNKTGLKFPPLTKALNGSSGSGIAYEPTNVRSTNSRSGTHMDQILTLKDEQISLLSSQLDTANKQIAIKDEQIGAMIERDHETNVLIQNLQQLVALPEARARTQEQPNPVDLSNIDSPI